MKGSRFDVIDCDSKEITLGGKLLAVNGFHFELVSAPITTAHALFPNFTWRSIPPPPNIMSTSTANALIEDKVVVYTFVAAGIIAMGIMIAYSFKERLAAIIPDCHFHCSTSDSYIQADGQSLRNQGFETTAFGTEGNSTTDVALEVLHVPPPQMGSQPRSPSPPPPSRPLLTQQQRQSRQICDRAVSVEFLDHFTKKYLTEAERNGGERECCNCEGIEKGWCHWHKKHGCHMNAHDTASTQPCCGSHPVTTRQLQRDAIKKETEATRIRFVELDWVVPEFLGKASVFVSHNWDTS